MREWSKHWVLLCLLLAWAPPARAFETKRELVRLVAFSLPNTYARYSPEWIRLRNSCAEAEGIVQAHDELEKRLEASKPKGHNVRAVALSLKDASTLSQFKNLPVAREAQLHKLDQLFAVIESLFGLWIDDSLWGVSSWARSLLSDARATRDSLKTAIETGQYRDCVRILDEYLPAQDGRSS